jgi:uncharacterized protein YjbJ (UPF0337 family)
MSISNGIRTYADTALEQGKNVTGQVNEFVGRLTGTARDNVSGFTSVATGAVTDARARAEGLLESVYESVKGDKRLAKVITTAGSLTGVVVETVQDRVVKPVASLTGRGTAPATKAPAKSAARKTTAARKTVARKTPAAKTTAAKTAAAKTPARKTTARKTTAGKATARKTTARKTAAKKATQS